MADPFDVTNSDINVQGGGVSPDFYRNLLSFGLATMSAASQPGAQFLGSLGKGGLAAMESSRQNNQARIQNQLSQQSLLSGKIDMATKLNNLNWLRQQQGLPPIDSNGQVQSIQANAPQTGEMNTPPSIAEPGSSAGASWSPAAGSSGPNQPSAVSTGPTTPAQGSTIGGVPTSIYNQMTPQEQQAAMQGYGYAMHGMADVGKPYTDFAFARLKAQGTAEGETPSKIKQERAQFRELRGGNGMPSSVFDPQMNDGAGGIVAEGAQTAQVQPGQNVQGPDGKNLPIGTHYRLPPSVNPQGSAGSGALNLGAAPSPAGGTIAPNNDPNVGMAAFQAAQSAGAAPDAPGQAPGINLPFPPPTPLGGAAPAPQAAPQAPVMPAAPSSAPPQGGAMSAPALGAPAAITGAMPTELPPQQEELLKEGTKSFIEREQPLYETANQSLASSAIIDQDIRQLGPTGILSMGEGAQHRLGFAKSINTIQQSMGVKDSNLMFDPQKVADAEGFNKEALRLGFADARSLGAREGQQVVEQSIKANPGLSSTYQGGQMLNGIIAEKAQRQKDMFEYKNAQLRQGVDPIQSETDFNKQYPGIAYVRRAMSQFSPINISPSRPGALNGLLPGTRIKLPNDPGPGKVIPLTPDYGFTIPPTIHSLEPQDQEQGGQ